ncbi:retropepsin-like aspartic protease [Anthocerotibacter panamensis]|uniref:retropepsin-like aspartic protease n=1 Tax=Anthocerotibacter panamensis TaxID=2857077 RepID=UPI001C40864E|nr:retropepsin-like aspartic protease [Anthocerotibacter panamensis]
MRLSLNPSSRRWGLILGLILFSLQLPIAAENELGKELLRQVRQCVGGLVPQPQQLTKVQIEAIVQECYFNYVVLGPDGLPPPNAAERVTAFIKASGIKIPQRAGQGQTALLLEQRENVFLVPVNLGGQTYAFLLDTGATNTILDSQIAQRLHLRTRQVPTSLFQQGVVGNECNSANIAITVHPLPAVTLGKATVQGLTGLGLTRDFLVGGVSGAVGLDLLSAYDLVLEPQQRRLSLNPPTPTPRGAIALTGKNGLLAAQTRINGQGPFTMALDTGASTMVLSERLAGSLALQTSSETVDVQGWCGIQKAPTTTLNRVQVANFSADGLVAFILPNTLFDTLGVDGIIGQNFLNRYRQHWRFHGLTELGTVKSGSLVLTKP